LLSGEREEFRLAKPHKLLRRVIQTSSQNGAINNAIKCAAGGQPEATTLASAAYSAKGKTQTGTPHPNLCGGWENQGIGNCFRLTKITPFMRGRLCEVQRESMPYGTANLTQIWRKPA